MSEQTGSTTTTEETNNEQGQEPKEFTAIMSQEDFDKAIQARIARERAKFSNYEEGQAAIARLQELEDAQKTEAQKQQEALAEAQAQLAELTVAKLRAEVAAAKGVPAELLTGSTQEELEAAADALTKFKGDPAPQRLVIPSEGNAPTKQSPSTADAFAEFVADKLN